MAAGALVWAGLGWWTASTALHWATAILAGQRRPAPDRLAAVSHPPDDFSIVAPMSGAADASAAYVQALMTLSGAGAEVLICVAAEDDGAVAAGKADQFRAPAFRQGDAERKLVRGTHANDPHVGRQLIDFKSFIIDCHRHEPRAGRRKGHAHRRITRILDGDHGLARRHQDPCQ